MLALKVYGPVEFSSNPDQLTCLSFFYFKPWRLAWLISLYIYVWSGFEDQFSNNYKMCPYILTLLLYIH